MEEDVGQFEIAMHDFVLDEGFEGVEHLDEILDCFILGEGLFLLEEGHEVALIAVLGDEVEVVGSFLDVVESDDVPVITGLEHLDFVLEELHELPCISNAIPLMCSLLMALMAMSFPLFLL